MKFRWRAMNKKGEEQRGQLEADSERHARQLLREQGLYLKEIKKMRAPAEFMLARRKINHADLTLFTRQLSTLVGAALPLDEALAVIIRQKPNGIFNTILEQLRDAILEGNALSTALQAWPLVFDTVFCTLVKAGEKSGKLASVLEKLAEYNEIRQRVRSKLTQALVYPTIMSTVAILVVVILLTTVVPKVAEQFIHLNHELPLSTRILLSTSDFFLEYGFLLIISGVIILSGFTRWLRKNTNKHRFHHILLRMKFIGPLISAVNSARYLRTLSILYGSGIPFLEGMELSAESTGNMEIRQRLNLAAENVRQGNSIHLSLERTDIFPPVMLYMISSGEKSGQLHELMRRATENQEVLLQNRIELALAVFEPSLIITMAAIVLFIVVSVLQPILQLNSLMQ